MKITAELSRDDKFWLVYVPEVGWHTEGRTVDEAKLMAADLAATMCDIPVERVELTGVTFVG